jgi:nucleoside-diphosphate-sugar epimerase
MEKILVTGAKGYLGACLLHELEQNYPTVDALSGRLEEIEARSLDYDLIVHSAGALRYRKGQHQQSNVEGTRHLLKGCRKPTRIIYISSKSAYGISRKGLLGEEAVPQPTDDYGKSKYGGEQVIIESGFPFMIIRPTTLIGLGVGNPGPAFPSVAMQQLLQGNDINLFTPDVLHEYLYVWDMASFVSKLIIKPENWNETYNASGPKRSLHQLMKAIRDYTKSHIAHSGKIKMIEKEPVQSFYLDSSKLKKAISSLNYTPDSILIEKLGEFINAASFKG